MTHSLIMEFEHEPVFRFPNVRAAAGGENLIKLAGAVNSLQRAVKTNLMLEARSSLWQAPEDPIQP